MINEIKDILDDTLQLGGKASGFTEATQLLGNIPELDSMAVVNILTAIEEYYGFTIDDDEISADTFATLNDLVTFVESKLDS